jgi:hypothetical protein
MNPTAGYRRAPGFAMFVATFFFTDTYRYNMNQFTHYSLLNNSLIIQHNTHQKLRCTFQGNLSLTREQAGRDYDRRTFTNIDDGERWFDRHRYGDGLPVRVHIERRVLQIIILY